MPQRLEGVVNHEGIDYQYVVFRPASYMKGAFAVKLRRIGGVTSKDVIIYTSSAKEALHKALLSLGNKYRFIV